MRIRFGLTLGILAACAGPVPALDGSVSDASCGLRGCACSDPGVYPDLELDGAGFSLRIPATHRCDVASPLVIELRGEYDDGELAALDLLSEHDSFVLVRPSHADREHVEAIVAALARTMPIDPTRIHVIGSGSGARVAAEWLHRGSLVPRGIGLVDYEVSAEEAALPLRDFGAQRPRVWVSTGARDVGIDAQGVLLDALGAGGFDASSLRVRARDSSAATAAWLYPELWAWLDRAAWPEDGPAAAPWVRVMFPSPSSLLSIDAMPDGTFVAGAADGRVFGTNASGKWGLLAELGEGPLVSVVAASGAPLIASTRGLARSTDGIAFTRDAALPSGEVGAIVGLADAGAAIYGVSSVGLVVSRDRGATWTIVTSSARLDAVAVSPTTHTVLAVGPGAYVRVDAAGPAVIPIAARLDDVAAAPDGVWWMVGGEGTVLRSIDDGLTFDRVVDPAGDPAGRRLDDLYCVSIGPDGAMIAGGAHGSVWVSHDGATLARWPTAGQGYIGAVRWIGPGRALILGELGLVAVGEGL